MDATEKLVATGIAAFFVFAVYCVTLIYFDARADHHDLRLCVEKGRHVESGHSGVNCTLPGKPNEKK